jgi:hypothetical protein
MRWCQKRRSREPVATRSSTAPVCIPPAATVGLIDSSALGRAPFVVSERKSNGQTAASGPTTEPEARRASWLQLRTTARERPSCTERRVGSCRAVRELFCWLGLPTTTGLHAASIDAMCSPRDGDHAAGWPSVLIALVNAVGTRVIGAQDCEAPTLDSDDPAIDLEFATQRRIWNDIDVARALVGARLTCLVTKLPPPHLATACSLRLRL